MEVYHLKQEPKVEQPLFPQHYESPLAWRRSPLLTEPVVSPAGRRDGAADRISSVCRQSRPPVRPATTVRRVFSLPEIWPTQGWSAISRQSGRGGVQGTPAHLHDFSYRQI